MTPNPKNDPLGWLRATGDTSWLSTAVAAEQLGITPSRLCQLRRMGRTPAAASMRVGPRVILWAAGGPCSWAGVQSRGMPQREMRQVLPIHPQREE